MATKKSTRTRDARGELESAVNEIKRQFEQSYALISAARSRMVEFTNHDDTVPDALLDMAEDVLAEMEWINRLGRYHAPQEVSHA